MQASRHQAANAALSVSARSNDVRDLVARARLDGGWSSRRVAVLLLDFIEERAVHQPELRALLSEFLDDMVMSQRSKD